jgi:hypothetical protein
MASGAGMIRVRHYTNVSAMRKIIELQLIRARDRGCVFVELARQRKLSPADAVDKYALDYGRGNAYVEFDIEPERVVTEYNTTIQCDERFIVGDVDLAGRNAEGFFNL